MTLFCSPKRWGLLVCSYSKTELRYSQGRGNAERTVPPRDVPAATCLRPNRHYDHDSAILVTKRSATNHAPETAGMPCSTGDGEPVTLIRRVKSAHNKPWKAGGCKSRGSGFHRRQSLAPRDAHPAARNRHPVDRQQIYRRYIFRAFMRAFFAAVRGRMVRADLRVSARIYRPACMVSISAQQHISISVRNFIGGVVIASLAAFTLHFFRHGTYNIIIIGSLMNLLPRSCVMTKLTTRHHDGRPSFGWRKIFRFLLTHRRWQGVGLLYRYLSALGRCEVNAIVHRSISFEFIVCTAATVFFFAAHACSA